MQTDAIRDSLKSLFSSSSSSSILPDNPFHNLAASLGAFVDQSPLWGAADADIIAALDSDGALELADAGTRLCRLASTATASSTVLGLPHVLRCVSREGEQTGRAPLQNSRRASLPRQHGRTCCCPLLLLQYCRRQGGG
jgi:hypothetical protein